MDRELEMLMNPAIWPYGDVLPVKRYDHGQDVYGHIRSEAPTTVFLSGMFSQVGTKTPREAFVTVAELLDAGWRPD